MATIDDIKKLREETGHSIAKCKEALDEAGDDLERAREVLREKGALAAEKKSDRNLGSGVVQSYIHTNYRIGSMVEVLCETDFVARNEEFIALARDIALHCTAFQPRYRSRDDVPQDVLEKITVEISEDIEADKTGDIREKIVEGKINAKMKEIILFEQNFIKEDTRTVKEYVDEFVQKFGERIDIGRFVIYGL